MIDILEAIGIVTQHKRATHAPRADSPSTRGTRSRKVKKEPTDAGGRSDEDVQRLEVRRLVVVITLGYPFDLLSFYPSYSTRKSAGG